MFLGANPLVFEKATALRENETNAEQVLWRYLRSKPKGYKFRRQHPIKIYIADFYCHQVKLIIEVDGAVHTESAIVERDIDRQQYLESEGISFLRFTNDQIENDLENVKSKIEDYLSKSGIAPFKRKENEH